MRSVLAASLAALLLGSASAQTFTDCNPTKKKCPADLGLNQKEYVIDFTRTQGAAAWQRWTPNGGPISFDGKGAKFTIKKPLDSPTIMSNFYLHYGKVEVDVIAAPGQGVVSSVVLQSDDLDEIDWEWIGNDPVNVQSNFYGKGNTTTYDRGAYHPLPASGMTHVYKYTIDWTAQRIVWSINGKPKRTVRYGDPLAVYGKNYPQTPMNVRLGIWAGGDPSNSPGTIEWAGGPIDYSKTPYSMHIARVKVTNYNPAPGYVYTDKSGSSKSIRKLKKAPKHHTGNDKRDRTHAPQVEARHLHDSSSTCSSLPSGPATYSTKSLPPYPTGTGVSTYLPGTGLPGTGYTSYTSKTSGEVSVTKTYTNGGTTYTSVNTPTGPTTAPPSSSPTNAAGAVHAKVGGAVLGLMGAVAML